MCGKLAPCTQVCARREAHVLHMQVWTQGVDVWVRGHSDVRAIPTQFKATQLCCGVSRVGHAAKRPRLYRSDNDFTHADSNFSRLPLDNNNVAIVKKRKKLNKERKERFGGRVVLENDRTQK